MTPGRGGQVRRDGAVRREVRRPGARRLGRRLGARAVRRHPRRPLRPARRDQAARRVARSAPAYAAWRRWWAPTPTGSWRASTCSSPSSPRRSRRGPRSCPSGSTTSSSGCAPPRRRSRRSASPSCCPAAGELAARRRGRRRRQRASATAPTARAAATSARWRSTCAAGCPRASPARSSIIGASDGKVAGRRRGQRRGRAPGASARTRWSRAVGPLVGGKGGGKDDVAQGGGTDASRIDEALAAVEHRGRPRGRRAASLRRPMRPGVRLGHRPRRRPDRGGPQRPLRAARHPGRDGAPRPGRPGPDRRVLAEEDGASRSSSGCRARSPGGRAGRREGARVRGSTWRAGWPRCRCGCRRALTTVSAEAMLRDRGRKGAKRRAVVDQAAAVVILQHALDTERARGARPASWWTVPESERNDMTQEPAHDGPTTPPDDRVDDRSAEGDLDVSDPRPRAGRRQAPRPRPDGCLAALRGPRADRGRRATSRLTKGAGTSRTSSPTADGLRRAGQRQGHLRGPGAATPSPTSAATSRPRPTWSPRPRRSSTPRTADRRGRKHPGRASTS